MQMIDSFVVLVPEPAFFGAEFFQLQNPAKIVGFERIENLPGGRSLAQAGDRQPKGGRVARATSPQHGSREKLLFASARFPTMALLCFDSPLANGLPKAAFDRARRRRPLFEPDLSLRE